MRKKIIMLLECIILMAAFSGCKNLDKILYPTKRSYNFSQIAEKLVKDLDERNNKDLASYFARNVQKKYKTKEIIQELENAEQGLGKIRDFRAKEGGGSGHRGGLGETVRAWEMVLNTDKGKFYAIVSWSSGDNSKDEKLERETEGIKNLMLYPEEYNNLEGLDQFVDVDFPVLYPGIQR